MTTVARHRYSFRDYLDVEEMSAVKHEFLEGEIYAMAGGTPEHSALAAAVIVLLGARLRGGPCRVYTSDLRLRVMDTGLATYPDAAVVCGALERDPTSSTHVVNPTLIVEVLSPSTEDYDRGEKREHYQRMTSLEEYVVVAQDTRRLEVWRRDDSSWVHRVYGPGDELQLDSLQCSLSVDEIYAEAGIPG